MDKHPSASHGNPVIALFAVLTVIGLKSSYVSGSDWNTLAWIAAILFLFLLVFFRRKAAEENAKPIAHPQGIPGSEADPEF